MGHSSMGCVRASTLFVAFLFVQTVLAAPPEGALYLVGKSSVVGVVLVHGRGMNPDAYVIGPLRKTLNEDAGYHTIALQLPKTTSVEDVTREQKIADMKAVYPASREMIHAAAVFLRTERGVKRVYLVAHSMGATIATTLVVQDGAKDLSGLVVIGTGDYEERPFDTTANLGSISKSQLIPVLDLYGDTDGIRHPVDLRLATDDMRFGELRKPFVSKKYQHAVIEGGGHVFYRDQVQGELTKAVAAWVAAREAEAAK